MAILRGDPTRDPWKMPKLGKSRFRVSCAGKIREVHEKARGNQSLEFLGSREHTEKTRGNQSLELLGSKEHTEKR